MNNNKALMCLLTASISALAAAPTIAAEQNPENSNNIIDIEKFTSNTNLTPAQLEQKKDLRAQIDILLSRKAPQMKIGESVDIMIDSYGKNKLSLKSDMFEKMGFAASNDPSSFNYDSKTLITENNDAANAVRNAAAQRQNDRGYVASCDAKNAAANGLPSDMTACPKGEYKFTACHTACHGVCHGACHGARGWR